MGRGPSDDRLGAKPALPPPSPDSSRRADTLFKRLLQMQRGPASDAGARQVAAGDDGLRRALPKSPRREPVAAEFGAGRRYDYALSVLASLEHEAEPEPEAADGPDEVAAPDEAEVQPPQPDGEAAPQIDQPEAAVDDIPIDVDLGGAESAPATGEGDPDAALDIGGYLGGGSNGADGLADVMAYAVSAAQEPWMPAEEAGSAEPAPTTDAAPPERELDVEPPDPYGLPLRPPPGAPMVRPTVAPLADQPVFGEGELARAASEASVVTGPDGSTSFHITFRDEVFEDLSCRITMDGDRVIAVFSVQNQNLRRLLEAESGRLRAQLEGRGLRVGEVRVEVG